MGEKLSFELRARRSPDQRCAFCHGGIGASAMACLRCQTLFHEDCAAETGRCPTFGCKEKPPATAERTFEPWVEHPSAAAGHFFATVGLWLRLLAVTTILSCLGVSALLGTIFLAASCNPLSFLSVLSLLLAYYSFREIELERRFQNGVRAALGERFPVVVRVFATRDGDGPRVDLRAEGAEPTEPTPISLRFGFLGPPSWLRDATRVKVHGISRPGPLVVEDGRGHRHFAPENAILRRGTRALRRDAVARAGL